MKQKKFDVREAVGLTTMGELLNGELLMKERLITVKQPQKTSSHHGGVGP